MKFGVFVDSYYIKKWQYRAIKEIIDSTSFELGLVVLNKTKHKRNISFNNLFFYLYKFFLVRSKVSQEVDIRLLSNTFTVKKFEVYRKGKFSEYFHKEDVDIIKSYDLDFSLRFGFGIIRGEILNAFKYGVWSFHHGDEQKYRGGPYCFWEIYKKDNVTASILQRLTNKLDGGVILKKGYFKTQNHSFNRNITQALLESSRWPSQVCIDIENGVAEYLHNKPSETDAKIFLTPSNLKMLVFVIRILKNRISYLFDYFEIDDWHVGYIKKNIEDIDIFDLESECINWINQESNHFFLADPFVINKGSETFFLIEKYNYLKGKGDIILYEEHSKRQKEIFNTEYHYSYPFIFMDKDDFYLIKESHEENRIKILKCTEWPNNWLEISSINNFKGIDTTALFHENRWWLFTSEKGNGHSHNLLIFYSDSLEGPWTRHKNNPVKTDIRSCRGAGNFFYKEGRLYRPSQNYEISNERSMTINRVVELSVNRYIEVAIGEIQPLKNIEYSSKIHTLSNSDNFTVIDACRTFSFISNPFLFIRFIYGKVKRKINWVRIKN
jgi:hypothetical protein